MRETGPRRVNEGKKIDHQVAPKWIRLPHAMLRVNSYASPITERYKYKKIRDLQSPTPLTKFAPSEKCLGDPLHLFVP